MNKFFFAAIAAVLMFASCSSNSESEGPDAPRKKQILGLIEKGPFVEGSEVTLTDLNKDLSQTGKSYTTNTTNDLGKFDFGQALSLSSGLVELKTNGYFYNECSGKLSDSQITLKAIADTDGAANLNVNLLTHLEYARVKFLVKSGMSFKQAKEQAETEILKTFAITDKIVSPEKISLTDNNKNASILLAISSIMLYNKSEAEFSELIAKFSNDLEKDGTIDNASLKETIQEGQMNCNPSRIKQDMEEFYQSKGTNVTIGDFSSFIDFNGDGIIDDQDQEAQNPGVIQPENPFNENKVQLLFKEVYFTLYNYLSYQNILDEKRMNEKTAKEIKPSFSVIKKAWETGFKSDALVKRIIDIFEDTNFSFDTSKYHPTDKALRAFILYNMAMEWGNIPIPTYDISELHSNQLNSNDVYEFCLKKLLTEKIPEQKDKELNCFSQKAADVLKAEIYMALGNKEEAKKILNTISSEDIFELTNENGDKIEIYSAEYVKYLKEEANGKDNSAEWFTNRKAKYGTFAALRRLNKVQTLTGIDSHFNLLPIPFSEILNSNGVLSQNPGYE